MADPDPWTGLKDAVLRGWFNHASGELFTGFPVGADDVVADIGCGLGAYSEFCATHGARVIAVDIDPGRVEATVRRLRGLTPPREIEAHVSASNPLPIATGSVSRVVCLEVIEHVDSPQALMAELARIGKPGALYLLACPDPGSEAIQQKLAAPGYFLKPHHIRILAHDEFARLAEQAGLEVTNRSSHSFFWSLWLALFWATGLDFDEASERGFQGIRHPLLDHWTRTWQTLLDQPGGVRVKQALDDLLPKSQIIVARKP